MASSPHITLINCGGGHRCGVCIHASGNIPSSGNLCLELAKSIDSNQRICLHFFSGKADQIYQS